MTRWRYEYECAHCWHMNDYGEDGHMPNGTHIRCEQCGNGFTVADHLTYMWPAEDDDNVARNTGKGPTT